MTTTSSEYGWIRKCLATPSSESFMSLMEMWPGLDADAKQYVGNGVLENIPMQYCFPRGGLCAESFEAACAFYEPTEIDGMVLIPGGKLYPKSNSHLVEEIEVKSFWCGTDAYSGTGVTFSSAYDFCEQRTKKEELNKAVERIYSQSTGVQTVTDHSLNGYRLLSESEWTYLIALSCPNFVGNQHVSAGRREKFRKEKVRVLPSLLGTQKMGWPEWVGTVPDPHTKKSISLATAHRIVRLPKPEFEYFESSWISALPVRRFRMARTVTEAT